MNHLYLLLTITKQSQDLDLMNDDCGGEIHLDSLNFEQDLTDDDRCSDHLYIGASCTRRSNQFKNKYK